MESNTWCPRLTAWIILSGSAVHVKAFGSALCSTTKRLIAACKSMTDRKTPRFNRLFVRLAKQPPTALRTEAEVGGDGFLDRHLRLDGIEEADELLVPVALHVSADHGAVEDVESSEQRGRTVTFVVVGHRSSTARLHWQTGLGAVERLDLALLIDREDDCMGWRIDIKADDVAQLVDKFRVGGELELFHPMRLKAVRTPDALDGTRADIDDFRHHGGGPVGRLCWRLGLGEHHDAVGDVRPQRPDARGSCLIVQEAVVTRLHEAFLPAPHTGLRFVSPAHDLIGANTVRAPQDDLSPPDMLVWGVAIPRQHLQTAAISRLESDGNSGSHAPDLHASSPMGIPSGIKMSDAIH